VLSFWLLHLSDETFPRHLALIDIFPISSTPHDKSFKSFLEEEDRERKLVGVEELRMLVGLTEMTRSREGEPKRFKLSMKASARATPKVSVHQWQVRGRV